MKLATPHYYLATALLLLFATGLSAQFKADPKKPSPPPGSMSLLRGFEHTPGFGDDTVIGEIKGPSGLSIGYDIGNLAGIYVDGKIRDKAKDLVWKKELTVDGSKIRIAYFKDGEISAAFLEDYANFGAQTADLRQRAEFLMMVMTYQRRDPSADRSKPFPEERAKHKVGDCWRARTPGRIVLLDGYKHVACRGLEGSGGEIRGKNGLLIGYDNGEATGPLLQPRYEGGRSALPEIKVNGNTLIATWYDPKPMATFYEKGVNFYAEIKNEEQLIDFLLMTMTFVK